MPAPVQPAARKGLFGALFRKAPAQPLAGLKAQLRGLGAEPAAGEPVTRSAEPTVLAKIEAAAPADVDLLALAFAVTVEADDIRIQLRARDGSVIDGFTASAGRSETVLFMPPGRAVLVARTPEGRKAKATLEAEALFAFPPGTATPARLAVVGDLTRPFDWSGAYLPPRADDAGGRLRARLFKDMTTAHTIATVGGLQVLLEPGDELSRAVFVTGFYEPESMAAIRALLPPGGVFLDVGAHCGMFTLLASSLVGPTGKVIAFEPSRREYERLIANIDLNALQNVVTSTAAVADQVGETTLLIAEPGHSGHNTTSRRFTWDVRLAEAVTAPTVTLDAFFLQHGLDRCDVIKMDIEGGSLQALKGAAGVLAKHRPTLILETFEKAMASNDTSTAALVRWLSEQGYAMRDIDRKTGKIKPGWVDEPTVSKNVAAVPQR